MWKMSFCDCSYWRNRCKIMLLNISPGSKIIFDVDKMKQSSEKCFCGWKFIAKYNTVPPLGSNRLFEILLAFPLLYFNADTPITDFVYAVFDLVQPMFWMERFLKSPGKKDFWVLEKPGILSLQVLEKSFWISVRTLALLFVKCTICRRYILTPSRSQPLYTLPLSFFVENILTECIDF